MQRILKTGTVRRARPAASSVVLTESAASHAASRPRGADGSGEHMARAEAALASMQRLLQANRELAPGPLDHLLCQITELRLKLQMIGGQAATD